MKKGLLAVMLAVGLVLPSTSSALTIFFDDFEDGSASDWVVSGRGGVYSPTEVQYGVGVVDGSYVAFIRNTALMSVVPGYTINDDSLITLTVDIGWRNDNPDYGTYSVDLLADGSVFATSSVSLTQGAFTTLTLSFDTGTPEAADLIGDTLGIRFTHLGGYQVNFDNVTLSNDTYASVPEPSTLLLLGAGLVGLGIARRRKRS